MDVTRITVRRVATCAALVLWAVSFLVIGGPREQFAQETGLDVDLVNLVKVDVGGTELTLTFVFINERTFQSKISSRLSDLLRPYVGQNAVYVNPSVNQVVDAFAFDPMALWVEQAGSTVALSLDAWHELTAGFLAGRFEVNPSGASQGSGSEGVVVLGDALDSQLPFVLSYMGERAEFDIGTAATAVSGAPGTAVASHDPIEVSPLSDLDALEDLLLHEGFSAESMALTFGLDPSLVRTLVLSPRGSELRLFLVRLEEGVRDSLFGPELLLAIDELIGTGALMVWAVSPRGAEFSAWNFYVRQGGTNYVFFSAASFVELTEGFVRIERVESGEVAAGIIRLPTSVDATAEWSIRYGTAGAGYP